MAHSDSTYSLLNPLRPSTKQPKDYSEYKVPYTPPMRNTTSIAIGIFTLIFTTYLLLPGVINRITEGSVVGERTSDCMLFCCSLRV